MLFLKLEVSLVFGHHVEHTLCCYCCPYRLC